MVLNVVMYLESNHDAHLHSIVGKPLTELIPNDEKEALGVGQLLNKGT